MDRRLAITYGQTGQTVWFYPREGVPSSAATVSIWRGTQDLDDTAELTGTADMDTTSVTVDAASGYSQANRRKVNLGSTTGVTVGTLYVIANADGQDEVVKVTRVVSADYVETEVDLAYDYASGATFKGFKQSFTIDSTWVADESNLNLPEDPYKVRWSYTVASVARRHWTYFDLVRIAKQHGVTVDSLMDAWPGIAEQIHPEQLERFIDAAAIRVQDDLDNDGIPPNSVLEGTKLDLLIRDCVFMLAGEVGFCPPMRDADDWARTRVAVYFQHRSRLVSSMKLTVSQNTSGAVTVAPARPYWFRS